jgi:hypothetical protein
MPDTQHRYRPSLEAVEAAIAAWNRAEARRGGRGPILGSSYHLTIAEMLIAANDVDGKAAGQNTEPACTVDQSHRSVTPTERSTPETGATS